MAPEQISLRVLLIGLNYLPEQTGIAPYTSALDRDLAARDVHVEVLSSHPHYPEWKIHPGFGPWTKRRHCRWRSGGGWTAQIDLEDGLRSTVDWYHANLGARREL